MIHPYELSEDDKKAMRDMRSLRIASGDETVVAPKELYDRMFDIIGRIPGYALKTNEDGSYVYDSKGRLVRDMNKPTANSVRFVLSGEEREHFMFQGCPVFCEDNV